VCRGKKNTKYHEPQPETTEAQYLPAKPNKSVAFQQDEPICATENVFQYSSMAAICFTSINLEAEQLTKDTWCKGGVSGGVASGGTKVVAVDISRYMYMW
jgi:hypothetical protein